MELDVKKRNRNAVSKRWIKEDKILLLDIILKDTMKFEKPTARLYYSQIIEDHTKFREYGWKAMRDKMRNLRASYTRALDWRNNICSGMAAEDTETSVRDYTLKLCEDFDALRHIFGSKINIVPLVTHETGESSGTATPSENLEGPREDAYLEEGTPYVIDDPTENGQFLVEPTPFRTAKQTSTKRQRYKYNNSTAFLAQVLKDKTEYLKEKLIFLKATEEKKLKLEEEQTALEREKIAWDRVKFKEESRLRELEIKNNFDLNKMRLEKEMVLKELELKYKYGKE